MDTTNQSTLSQNKQLTTQSNDIEKEIYFILLIPSEEQINSNFKFLSEINPQNIYKKKFEKGNGLYLEHNVFKLCVKKKRIEEKDKKVYKIESIEGEDEYDIEFSVKENTFVYDTELKKGNKWLDNIIKEDIEQKIIPLYNKLDIFLKALENNNENNKKEKLYDEAIDLYKKKKKI